MRSWWRVFASGLVVLLPILLCGLLVGWIYWQLLQLPVLQGIEPAPLRVVLLLAVFVLVVMSMGYLMRTTLGRVADRQIEQSMERFPGVRLLYRSCKRTMETILLRGDRIKRPIKVATWDGMFMTAFRTGNWTDDGREIVFIPGAPEVTAGFVAEVKPEDIVETEESFSDALVRLVTCGFGEERADHEVSISDLERRQ